MGEGRDLRAGGVQAEAVTEIGEEGNVTGTMGGALATSSAPAEARWYGHGGYGYGGYHRAYYGYPRYYRQHYYRPHYYRPVYYGGRRGGYGYGWGGGYGYGGGRGYGWGRRHW